MRFFGFGQKENDVAIEEPEDEECDSIELEADIDMVLSSLRVAVASGYVDRIRDGTPPYWLSAQCGMTEEDFQYYINNIVKADLETFAKIILVLKIPFTFNFKHNIVHTAVNEGEISDDSN
jgi:hypothetical protein